MLLTNGKYDWEDPAEKIVTQGKYDWEDLANQIVSSKSSAPAPSAPVPSSLIESVLGYLAKTQGGIGPGRVLQPLARAIQGPVHSAMDFYRRGAEPIAALASKIISPDTSIPTQIPSARDPHGVLNYMAGVPSVPKAILGELIQQTIKQGPDVLALQGVGAGLRAAGAWPAVKGLVSDLESTIQTKGIPGILKPKPGFSLTYRGGQLPGSQGAGATRDLAMKQAEESSVALGNTLSPFRQDERTLIGGLAAQPQALRQSLIASYSQPVDLNALRRMARPVGGVTAGEEFASGLTSFFPQPVSSYARTAQQVAQQFGKNRAAMETSGLADPATFARTNELNYSPMMYAEKVELSPANAFNVRNLREKTGFLNMRKLKTEAERKAMGYIEDPLGPMVRANLMQQRAVATRNYFNTLSTTPGVVLEDTAETLLGDAISGSRKVVNGTIYEKMSDTKSLGPLSGRMVRAQEAAEINATMKQQSTLTKTLNAWMSAWRFGKTIISPVTITRNFGSNIVQAALQGLSPARLDVYRAAAKQMETNGEFMKLLRTNDAPWLVGTGGTSVKDILLDTPLAHDMNDNMMLAIPKWLTSNKGSAEAAKFYGRQEQFFKTSLAYYKHIHEGVPMKEAIDLADRTFVNYDKMPLWVKQTRSSALGIPFISFDYGQAGVAAELATTNPAVFMKAKIFYDTYNTMAEKAANVTKDERDSIHSLYPGRLMVIFPYRDARGKLLVFDVTPFNPFNAVTNTMRVAPQLMGMSGPLQTVQNLATRNPILGETLAQLGGTDPYTQRPFAAPLGAAANLTDLAKRTRPVTRMNPAVLAPLIAALSRQETGPRLQHAAATVLPSLLGGRSSQNIWSAIQGKPNLLLGTRPSVPAALLQAVTGPLRSPEDDMLMALIALRRGVGTGKAAVRGEARTEAQ